MGMLSSESPKHTHAYTLIQYTHIHKNTNPLSFPSQASLKILSNSISKKGGKLSRGIIRWIHYSIIAEVAHSVTSSTDSGNSSSPVIEHLLGFSRGYTSARPDQKIILSFSITSALLSAQSDVPLTQKETVKKLSCTTNISLRFICPCNYYWIWSIAADTYWCNFLLSNITINEHRNCYDDEMSAGAYVFLLFSFYLFWLDNCSI